MRFRWSALLVALTLILMPRVGSGQSSVAPAQKSPVAKLEQNYPNPFNPATQIEYNIAKDDFVSLTVYDALGRIVKTLVCKDQKAGKYSVTLNAEDLTSGIYFYRITAGEFTDTKKLILLK